MPQAPGTQTDPGGAGKPSKSDQARAHRQPGGTRVFLLGERHVIEDGLTGRAAGFDPVSVRVRFLLLEPSLAVRHRAAGDAAFWFRSGGRSSRLPGRWGRVEPGRGSRPDDGGLARRRGV